MRAKFIICQFVYVYILYRCAYVYVLFLCISILIYTDVYICVLYLCMCVYMHPCTHTHTHTRIHTHVFLPLNARALLYRVVYCVGKRAAISRCTHSLRSMHKGTLVCLCEVHTLVKCVYPPPPAYLAVYYVCKCAAGFTQYTMHKCAARLEDLLEHWSTGALEQR